MFYDNLGYLIIPVKRIVSYNIRLRDTISVNRFYNHLIFTYSLTYLLMVIFTVTILNNFI